MQFKERLTLAALALVTSPVPGLSATCLLIAGLRSYSPNTEQMHLNPDFVYASAVEIGKAVILFSILHYSLNPIADHFLLGVEDITYFTLAGASGIFFARKVWKLP